MLNRRIFIDQCTGDQPLLKADEIDYKDQLHKNSILIVSLLMVDLKISSSSLPLKVVADLISIPQV